MKEFTSLKDQCPAIVWYLHQTCEEIYRRFIKSIKFQSAHTFTHDPKIENISDSFHKGREAIKRLFYGRQFSIIAVTISYVSFIQQKVHCKHFIRRGWTRSFVQGFAARTRFNIYIRRQSFFLLENIGNFSFRQNRTIDALLKKRYNTICTIHSLRHILQHTFGGLNG